MLTTLLDGSKESVHRSSIDKEKVSEIREERDRESEKDSQSQSKASLDPRVPVKKISIPNIDGSSSNPSPLPTKQKGEMQNSFIKSSSVLSPRESRERQASTSLVLETIQKLKKTPTSALNTVNVNKNLQKEYLINCVDKFECSFINKKK